LQSRNGEGRSWDRAGLVIGRFRTITGEAGRKQLSLLLLLALNELPMHTLGCFRG
jgi:hypothetical protein